MENSVNSKQHNYEIDFLKLFFMFMIVGLHSENILGHRVICLSGTLAVEFFFLVSGYLMAKSADKRIQLREKIGKKLNIGKETIRYILHKYSLIFPQLLICVFICVIIRFYFGDKDLINNAVNSIWELLCGQMYGFNAYYSTGVEWYLSVMFASMWILFPLYTKNRDVFSYILAPLFTLFILGWISLTYGNLGDAPGIWSGFYFKGMLRGFAEISAGVICYAVANKMSKLNWTKAGHLMLTAIEMLCYISAIMYMLFHVSSTQDTIVFLILMAAVSITFSQQSYIVKLFTNPKLSYCASFSSVLFFCHFTWSVIMSNHMINSSFGYRFLVYILLSIATTIFALLLLIIIKKIVVLLKSKIKIIL